jgi:hypothetical protein
MTKEQITWYSNYINTRSLTMPAIEFQPLVTMYNELFNDTIDFDTFINSDGVIHKIAKIENKLDIKFKTKTNGRKM